MKKSFLNIIILALVLINLTLTVLLTFALVTTSKKTDDFITKIAEIIDLDVASSTSETSTSSSTVNISDLETIDVESNDSAKITISVTDDAGKVHQALVSVAISLNTKSKDYSSKRASVDSGMPIIVSEINKVISSYTFNNLLANKSNMEKQILTDLQDKYQSDMFYSVSFTSFVVQ